MGIWLLDDFSIKFVVVNHYTEYTFVYQSWTETVVW